MKKDLLNPALSISIPLCVILKDEKTNNNRNKTL
jgi:hypothetical protein